MLTTHQIVQNATSGLFPVLLILIAWYCLASFIRASFEFSVRAFHRSQVTKKSKKTIASFTGGDRREEDTISTISTHVIAPHLAQMQVQIEEAQLLTRKATPWRVRFSFLEAFLFLVLALTCFYWSWPLFLKTAPFWWMHLVGPFFFLCFILKARRLLILIPLTFLAWFSWEAFSFINSFEKTLQATTTLATVEVLGFRGKGEDKKVKLGLSFRGQHHKVIYLRADRKIYFEGKVFRVASEVLLFGGKNIATVDKVFSDQMKPSEAQILVDTEEVPPLYRWKSYQTSFLEGLKKRFFHFLWKQFFQLRKENTVSTFIHTRLLEASICSPLAPGKKFQLKLRHVGGIECHEVKIEKEPSSKPDPFSNSHQTVTP